jgi:DNA mismatch endonuclease (patch repair protein)
MSRIRSANTQPEMAVRKLIFSLGYRYRLHVHTLPGRPDIVFASRRKIIFVHGCFWHQHPDPTCIDARRPKTSPEYWNDKLARNLLRDREHIKKLKRLGWGVLILWECELANLRILIPRIRQFLDR